MQDPHPSLADPARLRALHDTALLDSPAEYAFDRLTSLATRVVRAPVSLVSLVDRDRQYFKSCVGLPDGCALARQTPLTHSFCQHVVGTQQPLVVDDARECELLCENRAIADLGVIAYAGFPLVSPDGHVLGSFCVIDTVPRHWTDDEVGIMADIGAGVMTEIALRAELRLVRQQQEDLRRRDDELIELRRSEEALRARVQALEQSNIYLERFAYLASHDMQEPLRMVAGFLGLLQRRAGDRLDEAAAGWLASAVAGATRMQRMVQGLLVWARLDSSLRTAAPIDARAALDEAVANLGAKLHATRGRIDADALPAVRCERTQLMQVFQNLLANALKYRSIAEPVVRVTARQDGPLVEIAVADNGIGIAPELVPHVFDLFQRGAGPQAGAGLGLAMCRRIIERHGGRIWIEPRPSGEGATIRFTLPA